VADGWRLTLLSQRSAFILATLAGYTSTEIDISSLNFPADLTLVLTPSKDSESPAEWTFVPLVIPAWRAPQPNFRPPWARATDPLAFDRTTRARSGR
jgi:hypothetical protein